MVGGYCRGARVGNMDTTRGTLIESKVAHGNTVLSFKYPLVMNRKVFDSRSDAPFDRQLRKGIGDDWVCYIWLW